MSKKPYLRCLLPNGVELVAERARGFRSASLGVWVRAGSRDETKLHQGWSHLLEHMIFKGTSRLSAQDLALKMDRLGADFNAFTTREYTAFHLTCLKEDLEEAGSLVCDLVLDPSLSSKELEKEKSVVLQEMDMVSESPEELLFDQAFSLTYPEHPLGAPIIGTSRTVKNAGRRELMEFFRYHYRPSQIVVSLVGDLDFRPFFKMFQRRWRLLGKGLNQSASLGFPRRTRPQVQWGQSLVEGAPSAEQAHMLLTFPGLTLGDPRRFGYALFNQMLGGAMSSVLFQELREKAGLAYSVYSTASAFSDSGVFQVYAGFDPGKLGPVMERLSRALSSVRQGRVLKGNLALYRESLIRAILIGEDSVEGRMFSLGRAFCYQQPYASVDEVCGEIRGLSLSGVRAIMAQCLAAEGKAASRNLNLLVPAGDVRSMKKALARVSSKGF